MELHCEQRIQKEKQSQAERMNVITGVIILHPDPMLYLTDWNQYDYHFISQDTSPPHLALHCPPHLPWHQATSSPRTQAHFISQDTNPSHLPGHHPPHLSGHRPPHLPGHHPHLFNSIQAKCFTILCTELTNVTWSGLVFVILQCNKICKVQLDLQESVRICETTWWIA